MMGPRARMRFQFGLGLVFTMGCASPTSRERFGLDEDPLEIVDTVPTGGTMDVALDAVLDLCWADRLDPRSVLGSSTTLSSGRARFDHHLEVQLFPWRSAGRAELAQASEGPWCSGSVVSIRPDVSLRPSLQYRVQIDATANGWNGARIDPLPPEWQEDPSGTPRFALEFTTGANDPPEGGSNGPPSLGLAELFADGRVFDPERALCSCHQDPANDAAILLDLGDPEVALASLVGSSRIRDTGFPMIDPRSPSESFLLHKVVRDANGDPLLGVLGDTMPPDGGTVPYADLIDLARWIETGAAL